MISKEIIKFVDTHSQLHYTSGTGRFFVFDAKSCNISQIMACRESFAVYWEGRPDYKGTPYEKPYSGKLSQWVGFNSNGSSVNFNKFVEKWEKLEDMLKLKEKTVIHPTQDNGTIIFNLSPFWIENDTVRSFLSLFIRMLACYPADTINESIDKYPLAAKIKPAIKRFLEGYTKPTYDGLYGKSGVVYQFTYENQGICLTGKELAAKLIKP